MNGCMNGDDVCTGGVPVDFSVEDVPPASDQCFLPRSQKVQEYRLDCPCLTGKGSYTTFVGTEIDLDFKNHLMATFAYIGHGDDKSFLVAITYSNNGDAYLIVDKTSTHWNIRIKTKNMENEIVARGDYLPGSKTLFSHFFEDFFVISLGFLVFCWDFLEIFVRFLVIFWIFRDFLIFL